MKLQIFLTSQHFNNKKLFKVNNGLADINNRGIYMIEPIHKFDNILSTVAHQISRKRPAVGSLTDPQIDNKKTTHKYVIENKSLVYKKYDHQGKLISRIPWSTKPINEKA